VMREMDAFEQAYKNGYAAGMKAAEEKIVYCKECKYAQRILVQDKDNEGFILCFRSYYLRADMDGFCSWGERRSE